MQARRARWGMAIGVGIVFVLASGMASISWAESAEAMDAALAAGASSFRAYCANCHGMVGEGDGPVAEYLKVAPADLTKLSSSEAGEFPTERVYRSIDGREEVRVHGARDMPIWGEAFLRAGPDPEAKVEQRIENLIAYLRSIQK